MKRQKQSAPPGGRRGVGAGIAIVGILFAAVGCSHGPPPAHIVRSGPSPGMLQQRQQQLAAYQKATGQAAPPGIQNPTTSAPAPPASTPSGH